MCHTGTMLYMDPTSTPSCADCSLNFNSRSHIQRGTIKQNVVFNFYLKRKQQVSLLGNIKVNMWRQIIVGRNDIEHHLQKCTASCIC